MSNKKNYVGFIIKFKRVMFQQNMEKRDDNRIDKIPSCQVEEASIG